MSLKFSKALLVAPRNGNVHSIQRHEHAGQNNLLLLVPYRFWSYSKIREVLRVQGASKKQCVQCVVHLSRKVFMPVPKGHTSVEFFLKRHTLHSVEHSCSHQKRKEATVQRLKKENLRELKLKSQPLFHLGPIAALNRRDCQNAAPLPSADARKGIRDATQQSYKHFPMKHPETFSMLSL